MTTRTRASKAPERHLCLKALRWRKDVEAIVTAGRISRAGLQAVLGRATALSKEAAGEWRTVARVMAEIGVQASARHVHKLAVAAFEFALADIRELAKLVASSQREAFDVVRRRVDQNVDDLRRLLRA